MNIRTEMLDEDNDMSPYIVNKDDDLPPARTAFRLTNLMMIFGEALDKFQSDHCKLSDATHTWIVLLNNEVI